MTPYEIEKAVSDYLTLNWTATSIREINKDTTPTIPFIECYCKTGLNFSLEIQGYGERVGVFMINIFTKLGVGVQEGGVYAGLLEELFWHKKIGDIVCENGTILPYTTELGVDEALQAWHHQVAIPFSVLMEY